MNTRSIVGIVIGIIAIVLLFMWLKKDDTTTVNVDTNTPSSGQVASIEGCYVAGNSKDVYTLNVQNVSGNNATGTLAFKNFEKDSSSGTLNATYQDGILLGKYTFNSEGSTSVMDVIFKKDGDNFIRGYGPMKADGATFSDLSKITYDTSNLGVFKKGTCE